MDTMTDYSARVRQLFAAPQHVGTLSGPQGTAERSGSRIELSAELDGRRLAKLAFRVYGCPHTIAAGEAFCEAFEGRDAGDLAGFDAEALCAELAIPVEKTGRILLLEDAITALSRDCGAHRD